MWVMYNNSSSSGDSNGNRSLNEFGPNVIDVEKRFNETNDALDEITTWPKINNDSIYFGENRIFRTKVSFQIHHEVFRDQY